MFNGSGGDGQEDLAEIVESQQSENRVTVLPVLFSHIQAIEQLPLHHRDPFDRLLIAQSLSESAKLVSRDSIFSRYECDLLWE